MTIGALSEVLIVLALILANGVFAGAEIAILSVRKARLQQLEQAGSRRARVVLRLRREPETFLATVQIGITVVGASAAAFGGSSLARHVEPWLEGVAWLRPHAEELAFAAVVAGVSYASLVLGELVPKSLALRFAERYALNIGRPLHLVSRLARPLVWLLTKSSNVVLRPFGDHTSFTETRMSREELEQLLDEAGRTGSLDTGSAEIAARAVYFGELKAAEIMVPRNRIVAIPLDASQDLVWATILEEGHSRLPVYRGTVDEVVGYITTRDVLAMVRERNLIVLDDLIRPVQFVPETMRASRILRTLQRQRSHLAMVVDEHGGISGLLTLEDLIEELVGEIFDEDDAPDQRIVREPAGTILVAGDVAIREVNEAVDLSLPEGTDWSTVAGYCIALAGRLPERGTRLQAPNGTLLEVVEAKPSRIDRVRVTPPPRAVALE